MGAPSASSILGTDTSFMVSVSSSPAVTGCPEAREHQFQISYISEWAHPLSTTVSMGFADTQHLTRGCMGCRHTPSLFSLRRCALYQGVTRTNCHLHITPQHRTQYFFFIFQFQEGIQSWKLDLYLFHNHSFPDSGMIVDERVSDRFQEQQVVAHCSRKVILHIAQVQRATSTPSPFGYLLTSNVSSCKTQKEPYFLCQHSPSRFLKGMTVESTLENSVTLLTL